MEDNEPKKKPAFTGEELKEKLATIMSKTIISDEAVDIYSYLGM